MLVSIHQLDRPLTHLGQSPRGLSTPGRIDLARVACIMEAFTESVSDNRALISIEREAEVMEPRSVLDVAAPAQHPSEHDGDDRIGDEHGKTAPDPEGFDLSARDARIE